MKYPLKRCISSLFRSIYFSDIIALVKSQCNHLVFSCLIHSNAKFKSCPSFDLTNPGKTYNVEGSPIHAEGQTKFPFSCGRNKPSSRPIRSATILARYNRIPCWNHARSPNRNPYQTRNVALASIPFPRVANTNRNGIFGFFGVNRNGSLLRRYFTAFERNWEKNIHAHFSSVDTVQSAASIETQFFCANKT